MKELKTRLIFGSAEQTEKKKHFYRQQYLAQTAYDELKPQGIEYIK